MPVVDLTFYESQLIFHQTRVKSILSMVISLSSTFYNPSISFWEPIIERCTLMVDVSINEVGNPKKYIIFEMNQPNEILNINISTQMIMIFHKTYLSWMREIQLVQKENQTSAAQPNQNYARLSAKLPMNVKTKQAINESQLLLESYTQEEAKGQMEMPN